ncbi:MAG: hypothetical protein B7C24_05480 [Bacteroidetes bacterium 4572_77]|nr:MAG: hypothetical protein B7C24_05480 [Bacteroidetes bacterium 4572_77]
MILLEILKYILPSVVVFFTAYYLLKQQSQREISLKEKELQMAQQKSNSKQLMPIRLQAYERLILLLERIHPHQLIIRNNKTGLSLFQFQSILIKSVRDEFEHNLSQQLYVSDRSWTQVQKAKEDCIKQINSAASQLDSNANSNELGSLIIQGFADLKKDPIKQAIAILKEEVQKSF